MECGIRDRKQCESRVRLATATAAVVAASCDGLSSCSVAQNDALAWLEGPPWYCLDVPKEKIAMVVGDLQKHSLVNRQADDQ